MILKAISFLFVAFLNGISCILSFVFPILLFAIIIYLFHDRDVFKKDIELKGGPGLWLSMVVSLIIAGSINMYIGYKVITYYFC